MNVSNIFSWKNQTAKKRKNNPLLPSNVRGLIIGKGNCGKTTLLMNLLLQSDWLDYDHLYVFGKTLHQIEYQILQNGFENGLSKTQIENIFINQAEFRKSDVSPVEVINEYTGEKKGDIKVDFFEDCASIPDPTEMNAEDKNLLILDDCFLGPQNKAEAYYTRGRHNNCDTFYISQSYFRLPRHTVRENSNLIILFSQDAKNLDHIYRDHCEGDMTLLEFKEFCRKVWTAAPHQFITIDLSGEIPGGKYRENLTSFFTPSSSNAKGADSAAAVRNLIDYSSLISEKGSPAKEGQGIEFLPGDIKGLKEKLSYLLGEFRAGNTSAVRNEIVAITDELLRRKAISLEEYQRTNNYIQLQQQ